MRIDVIYSDNTAGWEEAERLDELIKNDAIIAFRRFDEWVRVGRDPIRAEYSGHYGGPERRGR